MKRALSNAQTDRQKVVALEQENASLKSQLEWFKQQVFGRKSEKRHIEDLPEQPLLKGFEVDAAKPVVGADSTETITYTRHKRRGADCVNDSGLRFDDSVPVQVIELPAPELSGPNGDDYEVISEISHLPLGATPEQLRHLEVRASGAEAQGNSKVLKPTGPGRIVGQLHCRCQCDSRAPGR